MEDFDTLPCYGCIELECKATIPSPVVMQRRLHALGQRTFNLMVDVTNYVMLELGQPTHAFDGDRLRASAWPRWEPPRGRSRRSTARREDAAEDLLIWNDASRSPWPA